MHQTSFNNLVGKNIILIDWASLIRETIGYKKNVIGLTVSVLIDTRDISASQGTKAWQEKPSTSKATVPITKLVYVYYRRWKEE